MKFENENTKHIYRKRNRPKQSRYTSKNRAKMIFIVKLKGKKESFETRKKIEKDKQIGFIQLPLSERKGSLKFIHQFIAIQK